MQKLWGRIDGALLGLYTKISHRFQRFTGRTNFFLAKCALFVYGSCALIYMGNYWLPLLARESGILIVFLRLVILAGVSIDMMTCDQAEEESLLSEQRKKYDFLMFEPFLKPLLLIGVILEIFSGPIIIMSPKGMIFFKVIENLFFLALFSFCYFREVVPLPPGKSKVREWAENIAAGFKKLVPRKASS